MSSPVNLSSPRSSPQELVPLIQINTQSTPAPSSPPLRQFLPLHDKKLFEGDKFKYKVQDILKKHPEAVNSLDSKKRNVIHFLIENGKYFFLFNYYAIRNFCMRYLFAGNKIVTSLFPSDDYINITSAHM